MSASPWRCFILGFLLAPQHEVQASATIGVGFCLDQIPAGLTDSGFTAVSSLQSRTDCEAAGFEWCPLAAKTASYTPSGSSSAITYYYYSACCTGRQGTTLIPDPAGTGVPTCAANKTASKCTRTMWQQKLMDELIGDDSGYDFQIAPTSTPLDSAYYGGLPQASPCICQLDSRCLHTNKDKSTCLLCLSSDSCSNDTFHFGLNFFKLSAIDLKSSALDFSVWMRNEWYDPRLTYDYQCYGGLDFFDVQAQSGSLENSRLWVPDMELVNNNVPMWGGMLPRLATVYSCYGPGRGWCGYVFWSYPGVIRALCRYKGLLSFPYDTLSCEIEFSAWAITGDIIDLQPKVSDGGISWVDDPNNDALTGITAGSSYQDYRIENIKVKRVVAIYACCPTKPYPALIYTVQFKRSGKYYVSKLVVPMIVLAMLSFVTFWMQPSIGERLGFAITTILALVANDITAMSLMPVCQELTFLNYLSLVCQRFAELALVETGVVLYLHHQTNDGWSTALVPRWIRNRVWSMLSSRTRTSREIKNFDRVSKNDRDYQERNQLFRQIFCDLDSNNSGYLDFEELAHFGRFIMGKDWNHVESINFMRGFQKTEDNYVDFDEFATFCDHKLKHIDDTNFLKETVTGFLQVSARRRASISEQWRLRAALVDSYARWVIPPSFFLYLIVVFNLDMKDFEERADDDQSQVMLMIIPMWPMLICAVGWISVMIYRERRYIKKPSSEERNIVKSSTSSNLEANVLPQAPGQRSVDI